ncbi:MAG: YdhR family protein [Variibacter sp.]|nr:YdhR family protein [Variibacter sp.]
MITAIVTAKAPAGMDKAKFEENAKRIAERFRTVPGLIRKQFLFDDANRVGGGVYLWENRAAADACYAGVWRENFRNAFGTDPTIAFFDSPVVVDNEAQAIKIAA